jgi:hypothetical protein
MTLKIQKRGEQVLNLSRKVRMGKSGAACKSGVRETPLSRVHEAESLACMNVDRDGQLNNVRVQGRLNIERKRMECHSHSFEDPTEAIMEYKYFLHIISAFMKAESREHPPSQKLVEYKTIEAFQKRRKSLSDQETTTLSGFDWNTATTSVYRSGGNILGGVSPREPRSWRDEAFHPANSQNRMILRINGSKPRPHQG